MDTVSKENQSRIIDACLLIESDLVYAHSVETLSQYVDLSPSHFQRLFKSVMGETVGAHLRRLRLENAAWFLKDSETPVSMVATHCGFESHAGFSRSFTRLFGCSPKQYREKNKRIPFMRVAREAPLRKDVSVLSTIPFTVEICHTASLRLAVMRFVGPSKQAPKVWKSMSKWCRDRNLQTSSLQCLGIHQGDWDDTQPLDENGFSEAEYVYDAAVAISSKYVVDEAVSTTHLPGGLTASVRFHGSLQELDQTWRTLVYRWLPASGYQPRCGFAYEYYPASLVFSRISQIAATLTGIRCELHLPIVQSPLLPQDV